MSTHGTSVLVVGGGVVGLMSAYALAKKGARVDLVDAGAGGTESSWAGGGIVCPVPPWKYGRRVEQSVARSRDLFRAWLPEIEGLSGIDCEYRSTGLLLSADPSHSDFVALSQGWRGQTSERVLLGQRQDFESSLPNGDWPAVLLPDVPQIRNPRLVHALMMANRALGVAIHAHCPVERLSQQPGGTISAWRGDQTVWTGEQVVLAAGAWSDDILVASGLAPLGVFPVRGQMLLYRLDPSSAPAHIIHTGEGYLIPRMDGHILAGSTAETVGFDRTPTQQAYQQISEMATTQWPRLREARLISHWTGLRPSYSLDDPAMGWLFEDWPGLWINTGHFRNGLGLAPACAERTAEALC